MTVTDENHKATKNTIFSLPREINNLIMCNLSDIQSLKAVILSHSFFYRLFLEGRNSIIHQIVSRTIPSGLLFHAVIILESSRLQPWARGKVKHLLHLYHHKRDILLSRQWTISDALALCQFHHHVSFFASNFAMSALSKLPPNPDAKEPSLTPSMTEWSRIYRNFYRFELYCNLFRPYGGKKEPQPRLSAEEQRELFFDLYSPWENEQLACVHDFLWRSLSTRK
jgi:hypothetical protein